MYYHCITMRKCCAPKTLKQVERCMNEMEYYYKKLKESDEQLDIRFHYECVESSNGRFNVHTHGMIRTPNDHVPCHQKKGYSIRIELCRSKMAWNAYITKSNITKQDILLHVHEVLTPPMSSDIDLSSDEYIEDALPRDGIYKKKLF